MGKNRATLIYLEDCILISKKNYKDWQEIQLEFWRGYKASLSPMTSEEMIDFFQDDYGEEPCWPFSKNEILHFFHCQCEMIRSETLR